MVKILNCYLYAKKVMALCLRVQFFLANPVIVITSLVTMLSWLAGDTERTFRYLSQPAGCSTGFYPRRRLYSSVPFNAER